MSKKTAHVVIIFADLLAMFIFWIGYNEINQVVAGIAISADSVEFNNKVGLFFIGIGIPIAHIFAVYEKFFPKAVKRKNVFFNYFFSYFSLFYLHALFLYPYA